MKIKKLLLHKNLLTTYKRYEKYPKGLNIKFNLALCINNKQLQRKCEVILNRTSRNIQSKVIKAVYIELHKLWQQRRLIKVKISETFSQVEQRRIRTNIRRRMQIIETNTKRRHQRKIKRDNFCIENNNNNKKRNRRFSRKHQIEKKREKIKRVKLNRKERIRKAKEEGPDQNAINLSSRVLTTPQKSVLAKRPSFIPTPNDVNWLNVRKDLDSFMNQLRYFANNAFQEGQEVEVAEIAPIQEQERADPKIPGDPPKTKKNKIGAMYKSKSTKKNLELFKENLEKDLINPKNVRKFQHYITTEEHIALKEIRNWDEQTIRIQDKRSTFVILDNLDYEEKVQHQINRSSFQKISVNPNKIYEKRVNTWIEKWYDNKSMGEKWKKFITVKYSTPGKMYAM